MQQLPSWLLPGRDRRDGVQGLYSWQLLRNGRVGAAAVSCGQLLEPDRLVGFKPLHAVPSGPFVLDGQRGTDAVCRGDRRSSTRRCNVR